MKMEAAGGPGLDLVLGNLVTLILGPVPLLRLRALLAELLHHHRHPHPGGGQVVQPPF